MSQKISKLSELSINPIKLRLKGWKNRAKIESNCNNESSENRVIIDCTAKKNSSLSSIKPTMKNLNFLSRSQNKLITLKNYPQKTNLNEIEKKLDETKTSKNIKDKFESMFDTCEALGKSFTDLGKIFEFFKEILETLLLDYNSLISKHDLNLKEYEECRHSEKILRKRFQKLAFENIQLNDQVVKKDEAEEILKEKIKKYKSLKIVRNDGEKLEKLKKRNFFIKKEINDLNIKIQSLTKKSRLYKRLVNIIKSHQDIPVSVKEDILNQVTTDCNQDFTTAPKEKSFLTASVSSNFNSFLNDF